MKTVYKDLFIPWEINELQTSVMRFIADRARIEKTPISLKEIIKAMEDRGVHNFTTIKIINVLLDKGYIRRAVIISNKSFFVQLRSVL